MHADALAVGDGSTCVQLLGTKTLVADAYVMKTYKQIVNVLEGGISKREAMDEIVSDSTQSEISNREKDTLSAHFIDDYKSELQHQHRKFTERRHYTSKRQTNALLDRTGAPSCT